MQRRDRKHCAKAARGMSRSPDYGGPNFRDPVGEESCPFNVPETRNSTPAELLADPIKYFGQVSRRSVFFFFFFCTQPMICHENFWRPQFFSYVYGLMKNRDYLYTYWVLHFPISYLTSVYLSLDYRTIGALLRPKENKKLYEKG